MTPPVIDAASDGGFGQAGLRPAHEQRVQLLPPSDSWKLNDAGKYYRDHKYSLDGYKPPAKSGK